MQILIKIIRILQNTPFNPNWLWITKFNELNNKIVNQHLYGDILEVGAGSGLRKAQILSNNTGNITSYIATDYEGWDNFYEKIKSNKLYMLFNPDLGSRKLDVVCSATNLPYEDKKFDCHISFEVLEHMEDIDKYFSEAYRVIKPGGIIYFSTPFMYPLHGDPPEFKHDYMRFGNGLYYLIAQKYDLRLIGIESNTGLGTTMAAFVSHYLSTKIQNSNNILVKVLISTFLIPTALLLNMAGYIIDLDPDTKFSSRFHVIYKKEKLEQI